MYEAVQLYKRACHLDPEVERKLAVMERMRETNSTHEPKSSTSSSTPVQSPSDEFGILSELRASSSTERFPSCQSNVEQRETHISTLPPELLKYEMEYQTDLLDQARAGFFLIGGGTRNVDVCSPTPKTSEAVESRKMTYH